MIDYIPVGLIIVLTVEYRSIQYYNYLFHSIIGLSITPGHDGVMYLHKKPQVNDMFRLLKGKSARWSEIGAAVRVTQNKRESIMRNIALDDNDRLEYMLNTWLETSREQSNVTWDEFIRILKDELGYHDVVKTTRDFLLT